MQSWGPQTRKLQSRWADGAPGRVRAAIWSPATAWRPIPPSWETLGFSLKAFNPLGEAHLQGRLLPFKKHLPSST